MNMKEVPAAVSVKNVLSAVVAVVMLITGCAGGAAGTSGNGSHAKVKTGESSNVRPISDVMERVFTSEEHLHIKLIGDSITQGVGSSDYSPTGEVVVKHNPKNWSRNVGEKSWAAMLKKRLESEYDVTVTNNGIRGVSTHQILYFWDELVDGSEDIAIVMLGTNNRTIDDEKNFKYTTDTLYEELQEIKDRLEANGTQVIFMSAGPVSDRNEEVNGKHFHMKDVEEVIHRFAEDNEMEYISIYEKVYDYMYLTDTEIDALLADGIHPNDKLHRMYYKWICEGLGLSRETGSEV